MMYILSLIETSQLGEIKKRTSMTYKRIYMNLNIQH